MVESEKYFPGLTLLIITVDEAQYPYNTYIYDGQLDDIDTLYLSQQVHTLTGRV